MGFKIIDPSEGRGGLAGRGRKPLSNVVRVGCVGNKKSALRFTISGDICKQYDLQNGSKINISIGTDEDHGSIYISKTTATDPMGYSVFRGGVKAIALSFVIHASKVYGINIQSPADCIVSRDKRGFLATLPASCLKVERRPTSPQLEAAA